MKFHEFPTGRKRWIPIVAVVAVIVAALLFWQLRGGGDQGALRLYGNVDIREVELAFRQPGRVATMAFEEGDSVAAGAVMTRLDATPYREKLAAAEAELAMAQAGLKKLRSGNRPQEIAQARERVSQAEAAARDAERNFQRQNTLLATGAASQRVVDAARAMRDQTAAELASAKAALSLAAAGFRSEDIAAGEAQVAAAQAAVAQARTALSDTALTAPSDGIVITRAREPGSMVASNTTVYTLSLRHPLYVRAYVGEPDLGRIAPGMRVLVSSDSSAKTYHGQIGFISPRAEFTPKTVETSDLRTDLVYRLRIVMDGADPSLRQGMPVTIDVDTGAASGQHTRGR
jgi:HlyD family secretion protein